MNIDNLDDPKFEDMSFEEIIDYLAKQPLEPALNPIYTRYSLYFFPSQREQIVATLNGFKDIDYRLHKYTDLKYLCYIIVDLTDEEMTYLKLASNNKDLLIKPHYEDICNNQTLWEW